MQKAGKASLAPTGRALLAWLMLLILLAAAPGGAARAQESNPDRVESFVYATTHYDGLTYGSALVTPDADTIYLLADAENVIAPRDTLIYYWALTNEYLADWSRKNELVEGTLEILQNGQVIREAALTDFVIQYDNGDILGTIALYQGEAAQAAYEHFTELQAQWREALAAQFEAEQLYQAQLSALLRERGPGGVAPEELPQRPEPPAQLTLFSTDPVKGYVVALPEGSYDIRMRLADGSIHPDSVKHLVMFSERRSGVAYEVTPKSRWTRPEDARDPQETIYAPPGTTVYLRPYRAGEYNALDYTRMNEPQDETARDDRTVWVSHQPMTGVTARIQMGGAVEEKPLTAYYVRQLATDARGYDIIAWDASVSEQPSFEGFAVDVPVGGASVIELVDANGNVIPGSRREIRALQTGRAWAVYAAAALPLVAGILVLRERRSRTSRLKLSDIAA